MNLYIMRHGETYWNQEARIQGSTDIPLTEYGMELARLTREGMEKEGLHFDRIYSSPLVRARQTAELVRADEPIPIVIDDRLREMGFGKAEGIFLRDLAEKEEYREWNKCFLAPSEYVAKDGAESYAEVLGRAKDFLEHEIRPLEGTCGNVLVVAHGALIRALLLNITGQELDHYWEIHQPNCCVNLVTLRGGVFDIAYTEKTYYNVDVAARGIL